MRPPATIDKRSGADERAPRSLARERRPSLQRERFLDHALRNTNNLAILDRASTLELPDWWLTAGAVFQTVWNVLDGREPESGIDDYDLFYFDACDLSSTAEDIVIEKAEALFADLGIVVDVCNEARVHVWYEGHFGAPAKAFASSRDAIDHFASTTCCYAITRNASGELDVYAPHGYEDLFDQRVRPNPVLAPREVYEHKAARWTSQWPRLTVEPWPDDLLGRTPSATHEAPSGVAHR